MRNLIIAVLLLLFQTAAAQTWQWTKPEPNTEGDANVHRVLTDSLGNVYQLGSYGTSLYLSNQLRATGAGGFVAKYNSSGTLIWFRIFKPATQGGAISIGDMAVAGSRLIITGKYNTTDYDKHPGCFGTPETHHTYNIGSYMFSTIGGDMGLFFTAMDLNGTVQWLRRANAYRNNCRMGARSAGYEPGITVDKSNNIYLSVPCVTDDALGFDFGGLISTAYRPSIYGNSHLVVAKYNASGNLIWSNYAQDVYTPGKIANGLLATSLVVDNSGNLFLNSRLNDSTKLGTIMFRTKSNNNYAQNTGNANFASSVLLKVSPSGSWLFAKEIASITVNSFTTWVQNMAVDNGNNLYMGISVGINCDCGPGVILGDTAILGNSIFLVKLDNNGNLRWKKSYGSNQYDSYANGIVFYNNALFLAGSLRDDLQPYYRFPKLTVPNPSYNTTAVGYLRYMVAKADTSGAFQWVTLVTGASNMIGHTIAVHNGAVYTGGNYRVKVTGLGRLNGSFTSPHGFATNLFTARINDKYYRVSSVTPTTMCPGGQVRVGIQSINLPLSATNTFTVQLSGANGIFPANAANIGSVQATGSSTITATLPLNLPYGGLYKIRVVSSDTLKTGFPYYIYPAEGVNISVGCPAPFSGFAVNNITSRSARISWSTIGCATGYRVQYRRRGTSTWISRNVNTNTGSFTADTLLAATTYEYRVASRCSNGGTAILSANSGTRTFTTLAATASIALAERSPQMDEELVISPNPVAGILNLRFSAKSATPMIQVLNATGQVVLNRRLATGKDGNQFSLDVTGLPAGTYFIQVLMDNQKLQGRFVKQ